MTRWDTVKGSKVYLVHTKSEFEAWFDLAMQKKRIFSDTEAQGLYAFGWQRIIGSSFGWGDTHFYIPCRHEWSVSNGDQPEQLSMDFLRPFYQELFARTDLETVWHNAKFDQKFYLLDEIVVKGKIHDTRILWQLFNENAPGALKTIASGWRNDLGQWNPGLVDSAANLNEKEISAWRTEESRARKKAYSAEVMKLADVWQCDPKYQGVKRNDLKKIIKEEALKNHIYAKSSKEDIHYGYIPIEVMAPYAGVDTYLTECLFNHVMANMDWNDKLRDLYDNEMELSQVIMDAEVAGVKMDRAYLKKMSAEYNQKSIDLGVKIQTELVSRKEEETDEQWQARHINLSSPVQLANKLVEYGVELTATSEKNTDRLLLDKKILTKAAKKHPIVDSILELRKIDKVKSTYFDAILDQLAEDDILHANFNQNVSTGRMCIAKGSLVQTPCDRSLHPNGIPIEDIKPGDQVYCYDKDGTLHLRKVLWAGSKGVKPTVTINWRGQGNKHNGELQLTADHRVRLYDGSWIEAQNLQPNDSIMSLSARPKGPSHDRLDFYGLQSNHRVISVEKSNLIEVFDLEVEEFNNFIANELCVHNSSNSPNLQNQPRGDTVRNAFIALNENYIYLLADYSQIEVRLTAHFSQDKILLEAYNKHQDVHCRTAGQMFDISYEEMLAAKNSNDKKDSRIKELQDLRDLGKTMNFAVIYGVSPQALSEQIRRPEYAKNWSDQRWVNQCEEFMKTYFRTHIGVKRFINKYSRLVREQGYIENDFGRIRHLPHVDACKITGDRTLLWLEKKAERQGVNALVQGTAGDLFKKACVRVAKVLKGSKSYIISFVHDEIQMYLHKDDIHLLNKIKHAMEDFKFSVPIEVEFAYSTSSWGAKKTLSVRK